MLVLKATGYSQNYAGIIAAPLLAVYGQAQGVARQVAFHSSSPRYGLLINIVQLKAMPALNMNS